MTPRLAATLLLLLLARHATAAPTIEALYLENSTLPGADALPGFLTTDVVRNNGSQIANINAYGDFIGRVHTKLGNFDASNNTIYYYFGSIERAVPTALRREAMLAGVYQNTLGTSVGIAANGTVTYSAALGSGLSGPASLWQGDTLIYQEGDVIPAGPLAGKYFGGSASSVFTKPAGDVLWRMSYADLSGGEETGVALVESISSYTPLLKTGDPIGALGTVADPSTAFSVFTNPRFSLAGSNFITAVALDNGSEVIIVNQMPQQFASGGFLLDGSLLPFADGGLTDDGTDTGNPIETLQLGSNFAVNEAGNYAFNAFTELTNDGDENVDSDVLIYNGQVLFREGDVIDGAILGGQFEGLDINDYGDVVFGWDDRLFLWNAETYPMGKLIAEVGTSLQLPDGSAGTLRRVAVSQISTTNQRAAGSNDLPVIYFGGSTNPNDLTSLLRLVPAPTLDGDFNQDGTVDLADYSIWRDTLGSATQLAADVDRDATVGAGDYLVWKQNFGMATNAQQVSASQTIPEPSTLACLIAGLLIALLNRRS